MCHPSTLYPSSLSINKHDEKWGLFWNIFPNGNMMTEKNKLTTLRERKKKKITVSNENASLVKGRNKNILYFFFFLPHLFLLCVLYQK